MNNYPNLASRVLSCPLLIEPGRAQVILGALSSRLNINELDYDGQVLSSSELKQKASGFDRPPQRKTFQLLPGGIAYIPITGTLVHRLGQINPYSGMTGYDGLSVKLRSAMNDDEVKGILFDIDSPGGEVSGCFDLADQIRAARAKKPIWAFANELACSAAYALAASCGFVFTNRTGVLGSIGVLWVHTDHSGALKERGLNITMIHAGSHKVDKNPYETLPDDVRSGVQSDLEDIRKIFGATVAKGRNMPLKDVLATEARTYAGHKALKVGLIDGVMPFSVMVSRFASSL